MLRSHMARVVVSIGSEEAMPALDTTMSSPPILHAGLREAGRNRVLVGDIHPDRADVIPTEALGKIGAGAFERLGVDVGQHHAGAFAQQFRRDGAADAAGAAGHEADPAREALRLRHALQLGLFEQPIFDVEGFLFGQAHIGVDRGGAAHHVDGIDVEFGGDAGRRLVAREADHADARDQVDHRIGVAHGAGCRGGGRVA